MIAAASHGFLASCDGTAVLCRLAEVTRFRRYFNNAPVSVKRSYRTLSPASSGMGNLLEEYRSGYTTTLSSHHPHLSVAAVCILLTLTATAGEEPASSV